MYLHLSGWNVSNHLLLHCSRILRSCCSISWSFLFVMALNILLLSANKNVLDLVKSGRSFMYKTNNKGPRTDPCNIPDIIKHNYLSRNLVFILNISTASRSLLQQTEVTDVSQAGVGLVGAPGRRLGSA